MNYKSFNDLSIDIKSNIYQMHSQNFDLIIGIPRSGMIPAYLIGLYLNCNVADVDGLIENRMLSKGITRASKSKLASTWDAKKILLVDDTISSGNSLKKTLAKIPFHLHEKITTLAIYSDQKNRSDIDIYLSFLPQPRVFEWNILHHAVIENTCFDIDGVLCQDPTDEENDDGEKYREFILNAKPLHLPTSKVFALVTSRLGKYRLETEIWLEKNNIEYEHLVMLENKTAQERRELQLHSTHKAQFYSTSNSVLFIESEPHQALQIAKLAKKHVFCISDNKMYTPDAYDTLVHSISNTTKKLIRENLKEKIKSVLPSRLKKLIKSYIGR